MPFARLRRVRTWKVLPSRLWGSRRLIEALLISLLMSVIVYEQARGIGSLLLGAFSEAAVVPRARVAQRREPEPRGERSGAALLERNPFDSSWRRPGASALGGPLAAKRCPELELGIVTLSRDSEFSLATLAEAPAGRARLVRVGDEVARRRVVYIGDNPAESSPAVWLSDGDELCQAVLRDRGRMKAESAEPIPAKDSGALVLARAGIRQRGVDERDVDRGLIELVAAHREELLREVRFFRPRGGKRGVQVAGIPAGSLLELLGLQNGDVILDVNGLDLSTPAGSLGALGALRSASDLSLAVEREGRQLRLEFHLH